MSDSAHLYRQLPSVQELLEQEDQAPLLQAHARETVADACRRALEALRQRIRAGAMDQEGFQHALDGLDVRVREELRRMLQPRLRRVLNATGVLLQTNLGRAPLSEAALGRIHEVARGYCNLEFDLEEGRRSRRDVLVEDLLLDVLEQGGALRTPRAGWGAAVVNNCAAATYLALNTLAEGGEVIVSRGELVEIGGGFRIPDILAKSGATLREVGTTNKTRIGDYAAAITPATRLLLRVHRSNFRIEGFTEQPAVEELVHLGRARGVPLFDDQGTGCVMDLAGFGLPGESSWVRSVARGASLVAASGDKLLGGPQCGLLVGERGILYKLWANPLFRVLRVDKLTYAALEATLLAYRSGQREEIPVVRMLSASAASVRSRCQAMVEALPAGRWEVSVVGTRSVVGGGTTPGASLPSFALALRDPSRAEHAFAAALRSGAPAVVARVSEGWVLLDLRTVAPEEDADLLAALRQLLPREGEGA